MQVSFAKASLDAALSFLMAVGFLRMQLHFRSVCAVRKQLWVAVDDRAHGLSRWLARTVDIEVIRG